MENGKAGFQPYEGAEPYIFASYSHADNATVLPILDALHRRGFRVWYDEGIPWTDEWEAVVDDHISRCAVCMAFHSERSRKSAHCDAELMYARQKNRPILSVYLEEGVRLSSGVETYLTRYHAVKWRSFAGMEVFLDRMEREEAVRDCKTRPPGHYEGKIRWNLSGDGVLTIAAGNPAYPVKMPDYGIGLHMDKSTAPWMREWDKIVSVVIEKSVTTIGTGAFQGCAGLASVAIPDHVTSIGYKAFYGCRGLSAVAIPHSVTEIGVGTFYGCTGLTDIVLPRSVTVIGGSAFEGCTGLIAVAIPDRVNSIGSRAFYGCGGLTSVTIPDSVTVIWSEAFEGCKNLREISLPAGVKFYGDSFQGIPDGAQITVRR